VLELGINDILLWGDTAANIVTELHQVALQLHEAGLRVVVCTLMPWKGWRTWTEARDKERLAVNAYIRSTTDFDAVVDLDAVMRDVDEPDRLTFRYDSGDHVHPNDTGYQAIANAMPLDVLMPTKP
ncbi:MAG TPA: GDSL-type esterase/lipase family protein, partial [Micromonosporaceae bacterium]|nr:GDSL-type esterase/lipase family protein [Micromonosporaceae bacterium]